jgi:MFS family permease
VLAISFTFLIKERNNSKSPIQLKSASLFSFVQYWKESPLLYKKLVTGLLVFTLINSSDVFLLLKVKEAGLDDTAVIGVYIFYNLVYAVAAYPLGRLSDAIGFKKTFLIGLSIFTVVYLGMGFSHSLTMFIILFFLYGIYAASTESIAKAWISNITEKKDTATAIGTYTGFQSIFTMIASTLAGWIWLMFGAKITFLFSGIVCILIILYILIIVSEQKQDLPGMHEVH